MFELKEDSLELQTVTKDALTSWSDDKRKEFVKTFKERASTAQYVLYATARHILDEASRRKFVSSKHTRGLFNHPSPRVTGSRDWNELEQVARTRSKNILKGLPPLSKVVSIIKPEISQKIIERDKLVAQCKKLAERYAEVNETILISDLDEKMTIGEFKKMIKDREKEKGKLSLEINEASKEAQELERFIDKELYSGIPGLSEAVVKVVKDHHEKERALDQMTRRVEEQVMFGDSEAAMDILRGFEKDEVKISSEIKAEFDNALLSLKLKAAPAAKKALKAK